MLKIDLGSILGAFGLVWSLEKVVCGRMCCATTEVWSFSSFVCAPSGFPGLQEGGSCCVGVILVWFKSLLWCFCIFWKCKWWRIVSDFRWNLSRTKMGMNPKMKKGEMEDVELGNFAEREEITPLGGGSKISEEDPPLWIGDLKIRISGSEENLETWEKTQIFI